MTLTDLKIVRDPVLTAKLAELTIQATRQKNRAIDLDCELDTLQQSLRQPLDAKRGVRDARRAVPGGTGRRGRQVEAELHALTEVYRQNPDWVRLTAERGGCAAEMDRLTAEHDNLQASAARTASERFKAELATFPWWQLERERQRRNLEFDKIPRPRSRGLTDERVDRHERESTIFGRVLERMYEAQAQRLAQDHSGVTPDMVARWRSSVDKPIRPWKAPTLRQELQLWGLDSKTLTSRPQDCRWMIRQQREPDPYDRETWRFAYDHAESGLKRLKLFLNVAPEFGLYPILTVQGDRLTFDGIGHYEFTATGLGAVIPPECRTGDRVLVDLDAIRGIRQCRKLLLIEKFSELT